MNALDKPGLYFPVLIDSDLLLAGLVFTAILFLLIGIVNPILQAQDRAKKRAFAIGSRATANSAQDVRSASELQKRRKIIADSLNEVTNRNWKQKRFNLDTRLTQAGLSMSPTFFMSLVVGTAIFFGTVNYLFMKQPIVAAGITITLVFGAPVWVLNYLRNKRIGKFVLNFPPALETIVRGVRAGLPLNDCFNVIAMEAQEPVRSEFRTLIEGMAIGLTLGEATERMAERIPTPETTFFAIVLAIQEKTGGNLCETLANLSNVLRDRKKLRDKIKALSTEATVSAGIIGSMPFLVILGIYFSTPGYLNLLFTTNPGKLILGGGIVWMLMGVFIMKWMINFDI